MKAVFYIRYLMVAWLVLLVAGCSSDDAIVAELPDPQFKMYIYLPEQEATTRGEYDIVSDRVMENAINSLQVWVFAYKPNETTNVLEPVQIAEGEDKTAIGSLYVNVTNFSLAGGMKEVSFYGVSNDFKTKYPYLNVYAIANAASAGLNLLDGTTTEAQLQELQLTGFGIDDTNKPLVSTVEAGLPMSGSLKEATVSQINELFTISNMTLKRAVSKIRFVFAKASNIPKAEVTAIRLDGHVKYRDGTTYPYTGDNAKVLPEGEYLFTGFHGDNDNDNNGDGYAAEAEDYLDCTSDFLHQIVFDVPATVPSHANPWFLRWEHEETRQEWEDKVNNAVAEGLAVESGRAYLRESPYRLSGTIEYTYREEGDTEDKSRSVTFTMADEKEFLRGHTWTVFGFFSEGGVMFEVDGWDSQEVTYPVFK